MSPAFVRLAALCVTLALLPVASGQAQETTPPYDDSRRVPAGAWVPPDAPPVSHDADTERLVAQRRAGVALMASGLSAQVAGALAAFFGFVTAASTEYAPCALGATDCGPSGPPPGTALFATGLVAAGLGFIAFFVGLGLDVDARFQLGRLPRASVSLGGEGLTLSF